MRLDGRCERDRGWRRSDGIGELRVQNGQIESLGGIRRVVRRERARSRVRTSGAGRESPSSCLPSGPSCARCTSVARGLGDSVLTGAVTGWLAVSGLEEVDGSGERVAMAGGGRRRLGFASRQEPRRSARTCSRATSLSVCLESESRYGQGTITVRVGQLGTTWAQFSKVDWIVFETLTSKQAAKEGYTLLYSLSSDTVHFRPAKERGRRNLGRNVRPAAWSSCPNTRPKRRERTRFPGEKDRTTVHRFGGMET